jgi:hypothetical protein
MRTHTQQMKSSMTRQRILIIRILFVVVLSVAVQTILISSSAPAQEADTGRPRVKVSGASLSGQSSASAQGSLHALPLVPDNARHLAASGLSSSFFAGFDFRRGW